MWSMRRLILRRSVSSSGFTWAAGSDTATKLRHGATAPGEAGQLVFELCEFYLELSLAGFGVTGEDVEDELRTVDNVAGQSRFDVAELRGGEAVIEQNKRGVGGRDGLQQFRRVLPWPTRLEGSGLWRRWTRGGGDGRTG